MSMSTSTKQGTFWISKRKGIKSPKWVLIIVFIIVTEEKRTLLSQYLLKVWGKWQQISINWQLFKITIYHTLMFKHWPMSDGVSNKLNGNSYSSFSTERSSFNIFNKDVYTRVLINTGILYIKLILAGRIENWSS